MNEKRSWIEQLEEWTKIIVIVGSIYGSLWLMLDDFKTEMREKHDAAEARFARFENYVIQHFQRHDEHVAQMHVKK